MLNPTMEKTLQVCRILQVYHRHAVFGLENIPLKGPVILISNHSLATYDVVLLYASIYSQTGRIGKGLGDRMIFKTPFLNKFAEEIGIVQGSPENAERMIQNEDLIGIAPGGMIESLRPSTEKYQIMWDRRKGFIRLAVKTGTPIVLSACPGADDIFTVYPSKLTDMVYDRFRFPLPLFRGVGFSMIPRPVKLIHCLSQPLIPPTYKDESEVESLVEDFHLQTVIRMEELMREALSKK